MAFMDDYSGDDDDDDDDYHFLEAVCALVAQLAAADSQTHSAVALAVLPAGRLAGGLVAAVNCNTTESSCIAAAA